MQYFGTNALENSFLINRKIDCDEWIWMKLARGSCRIAGFGVNGVQHSIISPELVAYICKGSCLQAKPINQAKWICLAGSTSLSRVLGLVGKRSGVWKQRTVISTDEAVINLQEEALSSLQVPGGEQSTKSRRKAPTTLSIMV